MDIKIYLLLMLIGFLTALYHAGKAEGGEPTSA